MKSNHFVTRLSLPYFSLFLAACMFFFTACEPQEQIVELAEEEVEMVLLEAEVEESFEDVSQIGIEAVEMTDRSASARTMTSSNSFLTLTQNSGCPTITHDSVNKVITVDFGTSCTGPNGVVRSGKVIVTYTKRLYIPGAVLNISLDNYTVNGKQIEGSKTIKNMMSSFQDNISLRVTLQGGKITCPDSTFATRDFTRTRTWVRGANPLQDEFHVDGGIMGQRFNGNQYSCNIISTLIYKRKCRIQGIHIPVQGIKLIKRTGKPNVLVDFGDGQCDKLVTVTVNGSSQVITIGN